MRLKSLLCQGLPEPEFYGDLVYKLKNIVGSNNISAQFIKIISHYKKIGYNNNVLQQTACMVVKPITVGNFAFLFNCTPVGGTAACSKAVVLLLLTFCLLLLPLWEFVIVLCFVVRTLCQFRYCNHLYGEESWLLCLICLPGVL